MDAHVVEDAEAEERVAISRQPARGDERAGSRAEEGEELVGGRAGERARCGEAEDGHLAGEDGGFGSGAGRGGRRHRRVEGRGRALGAQLEDDRVGVWRRTSARTSRAASAASTCDTPTRCTTAPDGPPSRRTTRVARDDVDGPSSSEVPTEHARDARTRDARRALDATCDAHARGPTPTPTHGRPAGPTYRPRAPECAEDGHARDAD